MTKKRILFVGLNTVDLQFLVQNYPQSNTKTKACCQNIFIGGPATNAAIACSYLGSSVDLCTPIGKHFLSSYIRKELSQFKVRLIDPIGKMEGKPDVACVLTSKHNGERTVISYHPECKSDIIHDFVLDLAPYSMIMFDGFHTELAQSIAKRAKSESITTLLDGGSWKYGLDELLRNIDIAICSNDFQVPSGDDPDSIFNYLQQRGVKTAAITRGDKPTLCFHNHQKREVEVPLVPAVDTLGAGDIFHDAFCHYYHATHNFLTSITKAGIVASSSCKYLGPREWMKKFQPDSNPVTK